MSWRRILAIGAAVGLGLVLLRSCQERAGLRPVRPLDLEDLISTAFVVIAVLVAIELWRHR